MPVLDLYSTYCVKNFFIFFRIISDLNPKVTFFCSFHIGSLFTNIPLNEIINIYAEALYSITATELRPAFPRRSFVNLYTGLPNVLKLALITLCNSSLMVSIWTPPLALFLPIFVSDFTNIYSLKTSLNLFFILDMLMTLLPFSVIQRNATSFFKNLILYTLFCFFLQKRK